MGSAVIHNNRISFIEKALNKQGSVLAIRHWEPASFYEIDLHLPGVKMHQWQTPPHIKCRVAPYHYRDYTPARWNADTSTCTLFIDAAHQGTGSLWASQLRPGDVFNYIGIDGSHQHVKQDAHLVMLGDQSAIGHFNALQQLASSYSWISGMVILPETTHRKHFVQAFPELPLETIASPETLLAQLEALPLHASWQYYLAGNSHLVEALRKLLKARGCASAQIQAQGFWK
ncbi:siderophore-interacting protein [Chitinophaga flava]|nr:SIP domain-containing protein [Chitinophaga flava]